MRRKNQAGIAPLIIPVLILIVTGVIGVGVVRKNGNILNFQKGKLVTSPLQVVEPEVSPTATASATPSTDDDSEASSSAQGNKQEKVLVCHIPQGNSSNAHLIDISRNAWLNGHDPHKAHKLDYLITEGKICTVSQTPAPTPSTTPSASPTEEPDTTNLLQKSNNSNSKSKKNQ